MPTKKEVEKEEIHPIDAGFERASKEYKAFVKAKMKFYQDQGVVLDVAAHEPHWQKVYVLGKLQMIEEGLKNQGKGDTDVKEAGTKTRRKKPTTKSRGKSDSRQLSLGV